MRKVTGKKVGIATLAVGLAALLLWRGFTHFVVNDTLREYKHIDHRLVYPQPSDNSVIVVHGDIRNTRTCSFKVFYNGQTVENLGTGTFKIFRLSGTPAEIQAQINDHYTSLLAWMDGRSCTFVNPRPTEV